MIDGRGTYQKRYNLAAFRHTIQWESGRHSSLNKKLFFTIEILEIENSSFRFIRFHWQVLKLSNAF